MRYQGTAVQIYPAPSSSNPDVRLNRRMALLVSTIGFLGLAVVVGFLLFGIISQRL